MQPRLSLIASAVLLAAGLAACGSDDDDAPLPADPVPVGDTVALTASGRIVSFNRLQPATLIGAVTVSGLGSTETLLGIDYRPADGLLYGLSSSGRLFTIAPSTGVATLKATLAADSTDATAPFTALAGDSFAVDFNPAADRLRVIGNTGQNLRINVDTGATTTDGTITPAAGTAAISAAAYTNSFAGTVTTQLFDIDPIAGTLSLQNPPNDGTLVTPLPLGAAVAGATAANGFDIDARTNLGYAAFTVGATTSLYTVNLATGAATVVAGGAIAGGEAIRGLSLLQPAAPTAFGLTATNQLVAFNPATPNTITATTAVTGLGTGETLVGIDFRPQDVLLYGIAKTATNGGRIYTIDPATGVATLRADLIPNPTDTADGNAPYTVLSGTVFSVDFNPAADRLRVLSDTGQSLRIVVATTTGATPVTAGWTITDLDLNRAAPASVVAGAYTNSFPGTTTTALFDLETNTNVLALQNPPNAGTLVDVGAIGFDIVGTAGFDIAGGGNGLALAALRTGTTGPMSLYSISLTTGAATLYRGLAAPAAQVGGAAGPALIDLAIRF